MLLAKTLRSKTFKLALLSIAIFGAMLLALVGYVRWASIAYVEDGIDHAIAVDFRALEDAYARSGRDGVAKVIAQHAADHGFDDAVYLLADPKFIPLAGNLNYWPSQAKRAVGQGDLMLGKEQSLARVAFRLLPSGDRLLVGRKFRQLKIFEERLDAIFAVSIALVLLLAATASVLVTQRTVGRIEAINSTSHAIMQSGLGRRIPSGGSRDEWDELVANLNSMLDRIEALMAEVKQATDNVAHDLRTPLARMRGRLEQAFYKQRDPVNDQLLIGKTIADLETVLRMFSSLTRISQIEAYDRSETFGPVNLAQVAGDVVELFDAAAEKKGVHLELSGDRHVVVVGDRDLLSDALANIVDNAIKYGRDKGRVKVEVTQAISGGVVSVVDDGPGIPLSERRNVFKRFYRLERSRGSEGNGLGLSLVAAVARLHGARIDLGDNSPGLQFHLWFPPPAKVLASREGREPLANMRE